MFTPSVINMVILILRLHGKLDAQAFENLDIHFRKHDRGREPDSRRVWKAAPVPDGLPGQMRAVVERAIRTSSVCSLGLWLPGCSVFRSWIGSMAARRDHMVMTVDTGQALLRHSEARQKEHPEDLRFFQGSFFRYPVPGQGGRSPGLFCIGKGSIHDLSVMNRNAGFFHEDFQLEDLRFGAFAGLSGIHGVIVTADDLLAGSLPADSRHR